MFYEMNDGWMVNDLIYVTGTAPFGIVFDIKLLVTRDFFFKTIILRFILFVELNLISVFEKHCHLLNGFI